MFRDPIWPAVRVAALKQRLIGILTSSSAQKIDFFLGYMHVNGFGYGLVADALRKGSIGVRIGSIPEGAAAAFSDDDLFDFPNDSYGFLLSEQGLMVHESTHAMKSLLYPFKVGWTVADTQDEAAAYLAGSLYMLNSGSSFAGTTTPHYVKADQIARSIQGRKGAIVSGEDEAHLRAFVAAHPVYAGMGINYYSLVYR